MARISKIEKDTDLRNYLLKATKHTALDHLRKHRRERIAADAELEAVVPDVVDLTDDAFVEKICNNIEYERIVSAITSLKDIYREVMYYHFVMDLSVPEVAKLMDCKVSTVKQRLVRGKKILYAQLFGEKVIMVENSFNRALREVISGEFSNIPLHEAEIPHTFSNGFCARWINSQKRRKTDFGE